MAALRELDPVAYVRFASVYRDFRDAADFHAVLREIADRYVGERLHAGRHAFEPRHGDRPRTEKRALMAMLSRPGSRRSTPT